MQYSSRPKGDTKVQSHKSLYNAVLLCFVRLCCVDMDVNWLGVLYVSCRRGWCECMQYNTASVLCTWNGSAGNEAAAGPRSRGLIGRLTLDDPSGLCMRLALTLKTPLLDLSKSTLFSLYSSQSKHTRKWEDKEEIKWSEEIFDFETNSVISRAMNELWDIRNRAEGYNSLSINYVVFCVVLCCAVLCCAVLCCAVLWYIMLQAPASFRLGNIVGYVSRSFAAVTAGSTLAPSGTWCQSIINKQMIT